VSNGIFGTNIFSEISLSTKSGRDLQTLTPDYMNIRVEQSESDKQTWLLNSMELVPTSSGSFKIFVPLFFQCFENKENYLNTDTTEPLIVKTTMAKDYFELGIPLTADAIITAIDTRLYLTYYKEQQAPVINSGLTYWSYDIYQETPQICASGSTSKQIHIKCPFSVFAMHAILKTSIGVIQPITNIKITSNGKTLIDLPYRLRYTQLHQKGQYNDDNYFSYFFSLDESRVRPDYFIDFSKMSDIILTATFDSIPAEYNLVVLFEYWTEISLSPEGIVQRSVFY
jgi:hypothetical protein